MNRRQFLKIASATGLAIASAPQTLTGAEPKEAYDEGPIYAIFNAGGGWDTTYLMDPKGTTDKRIVNRSFENNAIEMVGGISYAPIDFTRSFFTKYGSELLVINGIDSSIDNHAPCSRYISTGRLNSTAYPTFPALIAATTAPDVPLSFLSFGGYGGTGNLIAKSSVNYQSRLKAIADVDNATNSPSGEQFHSQFAFEKVEASLKQLNTELPRLQSAWRFLESSQSNSKALKRVLPFLKNTTTAQGSLQNQVDIAIACWQAGLTVAANFSMSGFDSHGDNDDQLIRIPEFLAGIDYLLEQAPDNIRQRLVVVIQSEIARTPWYNDTGGKDHWSVNSTMVLGPGINGGRVVGGTTIDDEGEELFPLLIRPDNLTIVDDGLRLRPEHFQDALRRFAGIDSHPFTQKFALNVPENERLTNLFTS